MQITKLHTTPGADRLILIFAGWSTSPDFYRDIEVQGWDVAVVTGYDDSAFDKRELARYNTIYVYAWSLGVYMASQVLEPGDYTNAFAINGTERPVDDTFGIPTAIYVGTEQNLNEVNLKKFRRRMVASAGDFKALLSRLPEDDDIEHLREELTAILLAAHSLEPRHLRWTKTFIPTTDHIIPTTAQEAFWSLHPETIIVSTEGTHLADIASIVRRTIPDLTLISHHFEGALPTYDSQATAQQLIAERLTALLQTKAPTADARVLELGQGSGLFTRIYAPVLKPASIDFVDLYNTTPVGLAPKESYHQGDAERWVDEHPDARFDIILTASCMQWFVNPLHFLRECSSMLERDGLIAISTFLPGNLRELDRLRPTPLNYLPEEVLTERLHALYADVSCRSEDIVLEFDTLRDALLHLRHTGVKGDVQARFSRSELHDALYNLDIKKFTITYRPYYAIGRKKS